MTSTLPRFNVSQVSTPVNTIRFQDHGQDFLEWDLDAEGQVIACRPFQGWLWCQAKVTNHESLRKGSFVVYSMPGQPEKTDTIRYPLAEVREAAPCKAIEHAGTATSA